MNVASRTIIKPLVEQLRVCLIPLLHERENIVWAVRCDPWGNIEQEYNADPKTIRQDIRLPGQHHDRHTNLYYNRHRYYDPKLGAYINQDPIGFASGELNLFVYAGDNPVSVADPLGLMATGNEFNSDKFNADAARFNKQMNASVERLKTKRDILNSNYFPLKRTTKADKSMKGVYEWLCLAKKSNAPAYSYLNQARELGLDKMDPNLIAAERYMEGYEGNYSSIFIFGQNIGKSMGVHGGGSDPGDSEFITTFGFLGNKHREENRPIGGVADPCACAL